jgi:hypothetical protein
MVCDHSQGLAPGLDPIGIALRTVGSPAEFNPSPLELTARRQLVTVDLGLQGRDIPQRRIAPVEEPFQLLLDTRSLEGRVHMNHHSSPMNWMEKRKSNDVVPVKVRQQKMKLLLLLSSLLGVLDDPSTHVDHQGTVLDHLNLDAGGISPKILSLE